MVRRWSCFKVLKIHINVDLLVVFKTAVLDSFNSHNLVLWGALIHSVLLLSCCQIMRNEQLLSRVLQ